MPSYTEVDYARKDYKVRQHHVRYTRFVQMKKLLCQDCCGGGGEVVPVTDCGEGPFEECGWCEGTGYVTPFIRGAWLRWKRGLIK